MGDFINFIGNNLADFWTYTGFANATFGHVAMIVVGLFFIYLAVAKEFEPMLLIPIGFGILIGNIPFNMEAGLKVGIYEEGSVLNILYQGVTSGWYPPLIFLGIGINFKPEIDVNRCSSTVWYFWCLHDCTRNRIRSNASRCYWYHWWG